MPTIFFFSVIFGSVLQNNEDIQVCIFLTYQSFCISPFPAPPHTLRFRPQSSLCSLLLVTRKDLRTLLAGMWRLSQQVLHSEAGCRY